MKGDAVFARVRLFLKDVKSWEQFMHKFNYYLTMRREAVKTLPKGTYDFIQPD
jgi:hypothetical protein